jgi:hypothetical protein
MYYSVALLGFAQMVVFSDIKKTEIMERILLPQISLKFVNNLLILCDLLPKPSKTPRHELHPKTPILDENHTFA